MHIGLKKINPLTLHIAAPEYSAPVEHPGRLKLNTLVAVG